MFDDTEIFYDIDIIISFSIKNLSRYFDKI